MINLLVVEDNAEYCKNIVNYISQYVPDVRIYSMAFSSEEAINIIDTEIPDLILMDLNLDDLGAYNILNFITENELTKYVDSLIVFSNSSITNSKFENSRYIKSYFKKPVELKIISSHISKICKEKAIYATIIMSHAFMSPDKSERKRAYKLVLTDDEMRRGFERIELKGEQCQGFGRNGVFVEKHSERSSREI